MKKEEKVKQCSYNSGVDCEDRTQCSNCGWNPEIAERRSANAKQFLKDYGEFKELLDIRAKFDESVTDSQVSAMYRLVSQNLDEEGCIRLANAVVVSAINDVARWKVMTSLYPPTKGGKAPANYGKDCTKRSELKSQREALKKEYPLSIQKGVGKPIVYKTSTDYFNKLQNEAKERAEKRWAEICEAGRTSQAAINSPKWLAIWTSWGSDYINQLVEKKTKMILENRGDEEMPDIIFDFSEVKKEDAPAPKRSRSSAKPNYWKIGWKNSRSNH